MVRTASLKNYSDIHFTNEAVAKKIINHFSPKGLCLEPFRGDGAFFNHLPDNSEWCEITEGVDFFKFNKKVDWIITNPPFSNLTEVFKHSFSLSENCVFLVPISKYWSSEPRLLLSKEYGGLKEILHLGTGRAIGFDIGFPFAALHFKKDYQGNISQTYMI